VRRRNWFVGGAVAASSLVLGVGIAGAAGTTTAKPAVLKCKITLGTVPPAGSASVEQPPSQGSQYGPLRCPTATFGSGVEAASFTVPDSGDTVGKYTQYFAGGTVHGTFNLVPQEGQPISTTTFTMTSWIGTVTVTGGTGTYSGISGVKGKKNAGVMKCTSNDTVHLICTEKVPVLGG
jgi:hypothetical protein